MNPTTLLLATSTIALILSICSFIVILEGRFRTSQTKELNSFSSEVCFEANSFFRNALHNSNTGSGNTTDKICVNTTEQLISLMKKAQETLETKDLVSTLGSSTIQFSPASAHKILRPASSIATADDYYKDQHFTLRLSDMTSCPAEHSRGVQIAQDGIEIFFSGIYYIYCNINFQETFHTEKNDQHKQTSFAYVHRVSPNQPMSSGVLLRSAETCAQCSKRSETSFIGGVFGLHAGDIIQVCLSSLHSVDLQSCLSFIGLFMLSV